MTSVANEYSFQLHDGDDANGVAHVVGTLLGQNLDRFPSRITLAHKMSRPVTIYSTDADSACSIVFGPDGAVVYNGLVGRPSVVVKATFEQILNVTQLRMRAGGLLPVGFFTPEGRAVLREIITGKLIIKGLLLHPVTALRTIALVSVVES